MASTVFANGNGLFHKGSGGKGVSFPDVCLSPPPPPAGPVPVPYTNKASASDLVEGTKTVMVEGQPTALKDQSYTSTSVGDEGGTQGGGLLTHKTKGKGYFKFWSLDVIIEGLNADAHSDPMGQNCGSTPLNGLCMRSSVVRESYAMAQSSTCTDAYVDDNHRVKPNTAQQKQAKKEWDNNGGTCWECKQPVGEDDYHDDHQPPLCVLWYAGGCDEHFNDREDWKETAKGARCRPHCIECSGKQSTEMRMFNAAMKKILKL
jgi:hypothetical protein